MLNLLSVLLVVVFFAGVSIARAQYSQVNLFGAVSSTTEERAISEIQESETEQTVSTVRVEEETTPADTTTSIDTATVDAAATDAAATAPVQTTNIVIGETGSRVKIDAIGVGQVVPGQTSVRILKDYTHVEDPTGGTIRPVGPAGSAELDGSESVDGDIRKQRLQLEATRQEIRVERRSSTQRIEQAKVPRTLPETYRDTRTFDVKRIDRSEIRIQERSELGGLSVYRDSDRDGISDFDEEHIYYTDPFNPHTSGDVLTDGERVLLGLSVHATSTIPVAVESPLLAGEVSNTLYEVTEIAVTSIVEPELESPSDTLRGERPQLVLRNKRIVFSGTALPNSFVTLYVFSTPIVVTVKADSAGTWRYVLDQELPDGSHELYVATVNNAGKILAKSRPVPFVKTAEAIEFIPLVLPVVPDPDPVDVFRNNLFAVSILGLLIFVSIALITVGIWRRRFTEVS